MVAKTHQPVFGVQYAIEWKDSKRVLLSINASPLISLSGDFDGMGASIEDITEKATAEEKIKEQLEELQRWYNAMLGRESRIHDLKREVNELLDKAGRPPRYPSAE